MLNRIVPLWAVVAVLFTAGCNSGVPAFDPGPQDSASPAPPDLCAFVGTEALSRVVPEPEETEVRHTAEAPEAQSDFFTFSACQVRTADSHTEETGENASLILQVFRHGGGVGKSGIDWAKDSMKDSCREVAQFAELDGAAIPAADVAGLGDHACGSVIPGDSGRIEVYLRVRRGADELHFDLMRKPADQEDTITSLVDLARSMLDRL